MYVKKKPDDKIKRQILPSADRSLVVVAVRQRVLEFAGWVEQFAVHEANESYHPKLNALGYSRIIGFAAAGDIHS